MTSLLLPRSTPSAQGVHSGRLMALLDRLDGGSVECHSLMVVRHGHVIAEGWWSPFSADRPHLLYSLTKSFTSVAVGLAWEDGLLSLDDRVVDLLPDHVPPDAEAWAKKLTVHHLLSMTTGHAADALPVAWALDPADLVTGFLRVPAEYPPGARHAYNNATSFVLARMVERVTGRDLAELLGERLFEPMGVRTVDWDRVGSGATFGFQGLHLTTEAVAAFGELLLRHGVWRGRRLVSPEWVDLATARHIETLQAEDGSRTADWLEGYGYHFWVSRHGYRGDGALGQFCLVLPERDLVVAVTAGTDDMQAVLDAIWECLLPGVDGAVSGQDDAVVAQRLRALSLPLPPGGDCGDADGTIAAAGADSPLPQGTSVTVRSVAGGGWRVRLDTGETAFEVEVGHGTWRESAPLGRPVVAAGAWQDTGFVADLYVITGPHRVRLTVGPAGATAAWNIPPLVGPDLIRQLRSPLMTRPDVG